MQSASGFEPRTRFHFMGKEKGNTEYRFKGQSVTVIGVKETKIWIIRELKLGLAPYFMQTLDSLRCYIDSTGSVCIPISPRICTCRAKKEKDVERGSSAHPKRGAESDWVLCIPACYFSQLGASFSHYTDFFLPGAEEGWQKSLFRSFLPSTVT